jgi:hypothetical protein
MTDARPAKHFARPPYRAEAVGGRLGWWGVMNVDGVNCLTFASTPGAVVTGEDEAKLIAKAWNDGPLFQ